MCQNTQTIGMTAFSVCSDVSRDYLVRFLSVSNCNDRRNDEWVSGDLMEAMASGNIERRRTDYDSFCDMGIR